VCVSGIYTIDVKYADMDITGSPFCTHVFDPSQVRVGHMPQGILGKPFKFDRKYPPQFYPGIMSFHSIHNVVDRSILQAMWEELAGQVCTP